MGDVDDEPGDQDVPHQLAGKVQGGADCGRGLNWPGGTEQAEMKQEIGMASPEVLELLASPELPGR
jgi:hypothetical protein